MMITMVIMIIMLIIIIVKGQQLRTAKFTF